MSEYIGSYTDDFGHLRQNIRFSVYIFNVDSNQRIDTSYSSDSVYLPSIFLSNVSRYANQGVCELTIKMRFAKLWLNQASYVRCPIPFQPNSTNFNYFLQQANQSGEFSAIGYEGERVNSAWTDWYASRNN